MIVYDAVLHAKLHGTYGHKLEDILHRTGKVVRISDGGIGIRNKEHFLASLLERDEDLESWFYTMFPSEKSKYATPKFKIATFEELDLVVLIGFDPTDAAARKALCSTNPSHGLLSWTTAELELVDRVNFPGTTSREVKQLNLVGYLFELIFDLMIARDDNVSKSPGFETPLGIFKK